MGLKRDDYYGAQSNTIQWLGVDGRLMRALATDFEVRTRKPF